MAIHRLMSTVAAPAALYEPMVASIGEQDMQTVQSKCYIFFMYDSI